MSDTTPISVKAAHCLKCDDVIWSRSRHDFHYCECGSCFVDGGRDYFRAGYTTGVPVEFGTLVLATGQFTPGSTEDSGTEPALDKVD